MAGDTSSADSGSVSNSTDLQKSISTSRLCGLWTLLALPYLPIGFVLCLLRICMSLQALLILLVFPEGVVKRYVLRVFFTVLGVLVTTTGQCKNTKLLVSNKISFLDHIVLHLAADCVSVSTGGRVPPLAPLFRHWTFPNPADQTEALVEAAKALPEFSDSESPVDYVPYAVQPEPVPSNGQYALLKFSEWPFSLQTSIQPVALSVSRPFPVSVSTVRSSGWWDLIWTLFTPITIFHVRFLPVLEAKKEESPAEFCKHVQDNIADSLQLRTTQFSAEDVTKWLKGPPPPCPRAVPNGPIIPASEFNPSDFNKSSRSELDIMVTQVSAVLPQVPRNVIRRDLMNTNSVDATITNLLEGHVQYTATATASASAINTNATTSPTSASQLFRRKAPSSSAKRQLSLDERKKELLQNARRRYMEKHGL